MSVTDNNIDRASKKNSDEAPQSLILNDSMASIKHKFLFMSSLGSVGKTSVLVLLATAFSKRGAKVGLLDVNLYSPGIHQMVGFEPASLKDSDKPILPVPCSKNLTVASIKTVMTDEDETGAWGNPLKISEIEGFISRVNWGVLDYLFIDTPSCPGEGLISVLQAIPDAQIIIVTTSHRVNMEHSKKMINLFHKLEIPIFGWIENMEGFLCQNCGQHEALFTTGPPSRAIFLQELSFLGQIPIDPHLEKSEDTVELFLKNHPNSQAAEGCNMVVEKIIKKQSGNFIEDRMEYEEFFR